MHIKNEHARVGHEIFDTLEGGIVLSGAETKSFYENRVNLTKSFARIMSDEMYLINALFTYSSVPPETQSRPRKILVHMRELKAWQQKIREKNLTIIPLELYTRGHFIKVKLGLAKSLTNYKKKEKLKIKDINRELGRRARPKV